MSSTLPPDHEEPAAPADMDLDEDADVDSNAEDIAERGAPPGGDFSLFLHKLRIQTFLTLGLLPNPVTGAKRCRIDHAEALIEDLEMLREKTAGNLSPQEERLFAAVLSELRDQLALQRQRRSNSDRERT